MFLKTIKKIVYTNGNATLLAKHNKAITHISFMGLHQEINQAIQDLRDQYMAIHNVSSGLRLGQSKDDTKAVLATEEETNLNDELFQVSCIFLCDLSSLGRQCMIYRPTTLCLQLDQLLKIVSSCFLCIASLM